MPRPKPALSSPLRNYIEWRVEHYREDRHKLAAARDALMPSGVPDYGGTGGGSGTASTTEAAALRLVTNAYIVNLERTINAIERVLQTSEKIDIDLITLVYWKRSHTIPGAGLALGLSTATAYRHIDAFLCRVAKELGLILE